MTLRIRFSGKFVPVHRNLAHKSITCSLLCSKGEVIETHTYTPIMIMTHIHTHSQTRSRKVSGFCSLTCRVLDARRLVFRATWSHSGVFWDVLIVCSAYTSANVWVTLHTDIYVCVQCIYTACKVLMSVQSHTHLHLCCTLGLVPQVPAGPQCHVVRVTVVCGTHSRRTQKQPEMVR